MGSAPRVFITGASGLLGLHLVETAISRNMDVVGQFHSARPDPKHRCRWVQGDFSSMETVREFLHVNGQLLETCNFLINNYGPITQKDIDQLTEDDLTGDFFGNVIVSFAITRFFLSRAPLESAINLGFDRVATPRPFRTVLSYAVAKQSLLSLTLSLAKRHRKIRFNMVSPGTIEGAAVKAPGTDPISPGRVAEEVIRLLLSGESGRNLIIP